MKSYMFAIAPAALVAAVAMISAKPAAETLQEHAAGQTIADGRTLFTTYCASCHGQSGRGDGPIGVALRVRPADLTQLARLDGGAFVAAKVERIVDGRDVKAHGSMEMPVWGDVFKHREGLGDEAVKTRIEAIVRYLASIQERSG